MELSKTDELIVNIQTASIASFYASISAAEIITAKTAEERELLLQVAYKKHAELIETFEKINNTYKTPTAED